MAQQIQINAAGQALQAELHSPASSHAKGAIVIAYGSDGLTDHLNGPWATMIRDHAQALAALGYAVVIPDYLAFTGTNPGLEALEMIALKRSLWESALSAAIDEALHRASTTPSHLALLGYSLGGHLCLRLRHRASVLISLFAPMLDGLGAAGSLRAAQIHHGTADHTPGTGFENAGRIETLLQSEGTTVELHAYPGAGHGFSGSDPANQQARQLSKSRLLAFAAVNL
jgi:dienelactone hydrolase